MGVVLRPRVSCEGGRGLHYNEKVGEIVATSTFASLGTS